jgi:hypothetical protein
MEMNREFLYKKPWIPNTIDDSYSSENPIQSWLEDDSQGLLMRKFEECSLDELIIELVDIFKGGNPSYDVLAALFGSNLEFNEEKKIFSVNKIERTNEDIIRVDMHVDAESYEIRHLYLYVHELPPLQSLRNKLNELHKDISFQETSNGFVIVVRECVIAIVKSISEI